MPQNSGLFPFFTATALIISLTLYRTGLVSIFCIVAIATFLRCRYEHVFLLFDMTPWALFSE